MLSRKPLSNRAFAVWISRAFFSGLSSVALLMLANNFCVSATSKLTQPYGGRSASNLQCDGEFLGKGLMP